MVYDEKHKKLWKNFLIHAGFVSQILVKKYEIESTYKNLEENHALTEEDKSFYKETSEMIDSSIQTAFDKIAEVELALDIENEPKCEGCDYLKN